jgi:hypothetical protein
MSKTASGYLYVSVSEGARHWNVSRVTIYQWLDKGYLKTIRRMDANSSPLIDVAASEKLLRERPEIYRGGKAHGPCDQS